MKISEQSNTWDELQRLVEEFDKLGLAQAINFEEFNRVAIVHHSSAIEGSTLTLEETTLLITEGITARGKPMQHHEMVKDHYEALLFTLNEAKNKTAITPALLQNINAKVNRNTGQVRNLAIGVCDDTKGDFRLGNVTAGSSHFVNYDKVPGLVDSLCAQLQLKINEVTTYKEIYKLSFDAHFNLVSIHPWFDGNGRTSRLLMNLIQAFHNVPASIVFIEDKPAYYKSLTDTREQNDSRIFRTFMCLQQIKFLQTEIDKFKKAGKGFSFMF